MEYVSVAVTTAVAYIVLLILCKLIGDKQISQMSMFDYITGITIGSIAAEMATELEAPTKPLLAMAVFALISMMLSLATSKSTAIHKIVTGRSLVLMDNGTFYRRNFKKAKIDINDFLTIARTSGYYDISQIQAAIMESNGSISFLPTSLQRPLTPQDMNLSPPPPFSGTSIIIDGKISSDNLRISGKDEEWLKKQVYSQGFSSVEDIYLGILGKDGSLALYPIVNEKADRDRFI